MFNTEGGKGLFLLKVLEKIDTGHSFEKISKKYCLISVVHIVNVIHVTAYILHIFFLALYSLWPFSTCRTRVLFQAL